jgi:hypothetical protein
LTIVVKRAVGKSRRSPDDDIRPMIVRRAAAGDEPILRAVRLQGASDSPSLRVTYERGSPELPQTGGAGWPRRRIHPRRPTSRRASSRGCAMRRRRRRAPDVVWWIPRCAGLAQQALVAPLLTGGIRRPADAVAASRPTIAPGALPAARLQNGRHGVRERDGAIEVEMERAVASVN